MTPNYRKTLYACYTGYITQAIVNNLAPLLFIIFQTNFHISFEMIGRLILINFGTQILADLLAARYVDRIGYRPAAVLAHILSVAGLVALGLLPQVMPSPYLGLVVAVVIYALGGGLLEVIVSPIVESLPGDAKASAMSLLHSFYCWGQMAVVLITTIALAIFGHTIWWLLPVLWAIVPLVNLFSFMKVPLLPMVSPAEKTPLRQLLHTPAFRLALLLMLGAGASELTMSQWSSLFAEKGLQVPKLIGDLAGPCLFAVLMGIGRTLYGIWGHRIKLRRALELSAGLCVICYGITIFVQNPVISLLGCALSGFSVALMWPGTFSLTAAAYPKGGTAMFGMMAVAGDLGGSVGPWLAGLVSDLTRNRDSFVRWGARIGLDADQLGLKAGLLVAAAFPLAMLISLVWRKTGRLKSRA